MKVSESGLVTWKIPMNARNTVESIIISISDQSQQQKFHKINLAIQ